MSSSLLSTLSALVSPRVFALVLTALFPLSTVFVFCTGLWVVGRCAMRLLRILFQLTVARGTNLSKYGAGKGAWAVVTGAADGIGREFALQLARNGFHVLLVGRSAEGLAALQAEIGAWLDKFARRSASAATLAQATKTLACVVEDATAGPEEYAALTTSAAGLDIGVIVNAAGTTSVGDATSFTSAPARDACAIAASNITSALCVTAIVLPGMLARRRGLVLCVGGLPFAQAPGQATYAASKAFLHTWAQALGAELAETRSGVDVQIFHTAIGSGAGSLLAPAPPVIVGGALKSLGVPCGVLGTPFSSTPFWAHALAAYAVDTLGMRSAVHYLTRLTEIQAGKTR